MCKKDDEDVLETEVTFTAGMSFEVLLGFVPPRGDFYSHHDFFGSV